MNRCTQAITAIVFAVVAAALSCCDSNQPPSPPSLTVFAAASTTDVITEAAKLFEQKTGLLRIFDLSLRGEGVQIFIGGESGVGAPDEVSVVTSPYKVGGEVVGTVGVIGPTRMAYDRVVPIVDVTAKLLSSALSQP